MAVAHRELRFLIAGVWNTVFGYLAFLGCDAVVRGLGGHYVLALFPAQIIGIAQAYVVHRTFVFPDSEAGLAAFLRYNLVYWPTFAVNLVALPVVVERTHLDPRLVQGVFVIASAAFSFVAHKLYSFRAPPTA